MIHCHKKHKTSILVKIQQCDYTSNIINGNWLKYKFGRAAKAFGLLRYRSVLLHNVLPLNIYFIIFKPISVGKSSGQGSLSKIWNICC